MNELCNIYDGTHQTPNYKDSGIMFLSVENIKDLSSNKYISYEDFKKNFKVYPEKNDILMTRIGDIGTTNIVKENSLKAYYVSLALLKCRSINPYYLNFAIKSDYVQNGLKLRSLLTAIPMKINKDQIGEVDINYPIDPEEQSNIGKLFDNLDNLITLHQRKFNDILVYKLRKKILFLKFTKNVWEQRKLGDLMDITSVKRIHQSDWTESGIRFLRARDIVADYKKEEVEDKLYISKEKYEEYSLISGKVQIGDLLVTGVGTIGIPYLIRNNEPIYFKDGNIIWFKNNNKIDDNFLYYSFVGSKIQNFINEKSGVGTVGTYTIQSGKETPIMLTSNNEQRKISNLMSNLDNLITLHHRKYTYIFYSWEQRKLEETSNRFDNLRVPVSANEREKGTTPYYGANGIQDYVKGFTHNGEYVLIAEDGANDLKNYPVKYVNGLFWANNHVHVVQGKEGICDNKYLKYCFTKTNIESLLVGGGRAKLNANIMMGIELTVPSLNEQVELGRMFYELDNLITLHQHKELKRRNDNNEHLRW